MKTLVERSYHQHSRIYFAHIDLVLNRLPPNRVKGRRMGRGSMCAEAGWVAVGWSIEGEWGYG